MSKAADGRINRGVENRTKIVNAMMKLVGEGVSVPTAEQVAKQAKVGLRTVFRHFSDMESLYSAMANQLEEQERPYLAGGRRNNSFTARCRAMIMRRSTSYERISVYIRAAKIKLHNSDVITERELFFAKEFRADLLSWLPELSEESPQIIDALDMALSFEAWDRLRFHQQLSKQKAINVIEVTVSSLTQHISQK